MRLLACLALTLSSAAADAPASSEITRLADAYVAVELEADPTFAYLLGAKVTRHDNLPDRTPAAVTARETRIDTIRQTLRKVDGRRLSPSDAILKATLEERLEASVAKRVCRRELWAVDFMEGWQWSLPLILANQPVGTAPARADALERLRDIPRYLDTEIANLKRGVDAGYTVPKAVAARALKQIDGLIADDPAATPFFDPARRDGDPAFKAAAATVIREQVTPAVRRYRDYQRDEYQPKARDTLGLSALPNGEACWRSLYRDRTTLDRSPGEVLAAGETAVARYRAEAVDYGRKTWGTPDLPALVERMRAATDDKHASEAAMMAELSDAIERGRAAIVRFVDRVPTQSLVIAPYPAHQRGVGLGASYGPSPSAETPASFRIDPAIWTADTRSRTEIDAFHEGWFGHHLEVAYSLGRPAHDLTRIAPIAAFTEGWARYGEALAEEAGLYRTAWAPVRRRFVPARGMVIDPGIHALGWTREQAVAFLMQSGGSRAAADAYVDRAASMPASLTAYDTGGLEIVALRQQAEKALGSRFDIKGFHRAVLQQGPVPLALLRANVERWIAQERRR